MEMLTKLDEFILLSVLTLREEAYGKNIFRLIRNVTGKNISLGGIYFPLERLVKKEFVESWEGESNNDRRGFRKKFYRITPEGMKALKEIKEANDCMWSTYMNSNELREAGKV